MNKSIFSYLNIAAKVAKGGERRNFFLGAVGVRSDGAMVYSFNSPTQFPCKAAHAEHRLAKKLDAGSTVYVARVSNGQFAMSRPCASCMTILRNKRVRRIYYTIAPDEFGVINV